MFHGDHMLKIPYINIHLEPEVRRWYFESPQIPRMVTYSLRNDTTWPTYNYQFCYWTQGHDRGSIIAQSRHSVLEYHDSDAAVISGESTCWPASHKTVTDSQYVTTESTAETDDDSVFPLTPDSKRTGSIQRIVDTSARAASPTSSHHDDLPETIGSKTEDIGDIFLQHLETLGPHIFRLVVHYKEAVRERQRMRLYTTYWEAEENTRRGTLLHLLYQDAQNEFVRSEQQSQTLLNMALEKHSPAAIASDTKFLAAVCDRNKASLHWTDTQLDVIKDHINRSQLFRSSVDGDSVQKSDAA
ncbi:uncharacterized protein F5891DRAFT_984809 [Suillus fuscotomentosus]|uniref:Uncharacterized protein n=1 Tax=Suillus fuscotomentosus TaxID=1912939 RepID=A0AAD4HFP1_9AGAM|nr:uncharacterized protein F5891DRAFT_984809 [Suillus fuscotomentosus]KAG1894792.1 hypothetical protein F5891DRAFT_984809 [Suillus fuscotomentosus]